MHRASEQTRAPTRRRAILALLSGGAGAFSSGAAAAKKGKHKRCKKVDPCPQRVACKCVNDELCVFLRWPDTAVAPAEICAAHCLNHGGATEQSSSIRDLGYVAICRHSGLTGLARCPLF